MSENNNMELWNAVCETDPAITKQFKGKGGFRGTAVCAQAQRKKATEMFGMFGVGWNVTGETYELLQVSDDCHNNILTYSAQLKYKYDGTEGWFGITSEIAVWTYNSTYKNWSVTNDMRKKVRTDAITKGLSELGFNADIFLGLYDDNKYVNEMKEKHGTPPPANREPVKPLPEWAQGLTPKTRGQIKSKLKWTAETCEAHWNGLKDDEVSKADQFAVLVNELAEGAK